MCESLSTNPNAQRPKRLWLRGALVLACLGGCGRLGYQPVGGALDGSPDAEPRDGGVRDTGGDAGFPDAKIDDAGSDAGDDAGAAMCRDVVPTRRAVDVECGPFFSCAILEDGALMCWGENGQGQLGLGDTGDRTEPARVAPGTTWRAAALGVRHSCAIRSDGSLWCWGANDEAQLGLGDRLARGNLPLQVEAASDWVAIAAGDKHSCGIRSGGALYCWGSNADGQIGLGAPVLRALAPTRVGTEVGWDGLDAGPQHTCAIRAAGLSCWGSNNAGQLGVGDTAVRTVPTAVAGALSARRVSAGETHTCAVGWSGELYCWGQGSGGRLGTGGVADELVPVPVIGTIGWGQITTGKRTSLGIDSSRALFGFGNNNEGELPTAGPLGSLVPIPLLAGESFLDVSAGEEHTCVLRADGTVGCSGANLSGQLGDGTTTAAPLPTTICFR